MSSAVQPQTSPLTPRPRWMPRARVLACLQALRPLGLMLALLVLRTLVPALLPPAAQAQPAVARAELRLDPVPPPLELTEADFRSRLREGWRPVPLPDTWSHRGLQGAGVGHYRFSFELASAPSRLWVMCVPRMSRVHEVRVNGGLISGDLLDLHAPPPGDTRASEHWITVPPHLLRAGTNQLEISVVHARRAGLSTVVIGPAETMQATERQNHWLALLPSMLHLVGAGLAVFMLLVWWLRPAERLTGLFGLLWMLCGLMQLLLVIAPPGPDERVDAALLLLEITALALGGWIALRRAGRLQSVTAGALQVLTVLMAGLTLWGALTGTLDEVRDWLHPALTACGALLLPAVWHGTRTMHPPLRLMLGAALLLLLGATLHDDLSWHGLSSVMDGYWLPLVLPLVLLLVGSLMIRRLVEALLQVEQLNADLERRVVERTAALQQANQAKSRFLAAASHDLRQPVVTIGLLIDLLREQVPAPLRPMTERVDEAVSSMEDLLKGLLDLSRLEAGTVRPRPQPVALQPLLDAIASHEGEAARRKGLRLRLRPSAATVVSDPVLLEQILRNLVSNAVRYTERGGVLVGVRRRGERLQIDVIDTGVGIAPEDQQAVFEEFVQLDTRIGAPRGPALGDSSRGLGLGLSIVQRSAALLGHRLLLDSRPGRGSRFSLQLDSAVPLQPVPAPSGAARRRPLQGLRLTVVEDEPTVQAALRARLEAWGAVVQCHDGLTPLRHQLVQRPRGHSGIDLLITDHRLRGASGLDVVEAVRSYGGPVPVLVITGDTSPGDLSLLSASGLQVLHKPFRAEQLLVAIEQVLAGAAELTAARSAPLPPASRPG
ncbi:ATP-binding response regulator [Sphaerotilus uruguayifluvii]|uniref:histidine kinase n=1 Tax=Sphaerotilus uruguayifluvii TaxID=2735897 RepID=A0ABX2FZ55_9BURK|nr:hybrid sensor histidine kinase/response regulator [Leptothrix sp. C29]NRT55294.1 signal transduction histidine kinase/CheY-like chemotaxis protein [Leptothrix sp. C29]